MNSPKSKVTIVGLGYIGLPTAAVLAGVGHDVVGVDVNARIVDVVNRGEIHIVEPDLEELVRNAVSSGCLRASTVVEPSDVYIIAVPTPFMEGHQPDLSYVETATRSIAPHLLRGGLVILESTSPVGTTEKVAGWLGAERPDLVLSVLGSREVDINVAYCPERVLPGKVVTELLNNDRIIGGLTPKCANKASEFYKTFVKGDCLETDSRTAEMTKLTENSFRDLNIAFANELSIICDRLSINVWELICLANRHPRVNILNPGPGVGGHCIAVDPWFIVDSAPDLAKLIRVARQVNDSKPEWVRQRVIEALEELGMGNRAVVACLGLAFKADIDDLRESPSVDIVERLIGSPLISELLVVEPYVQELPTRLQGGANLADLDHALLCADIIVLLVDHQLFTTIDRERLAGKVVIDTRGIWR